MTKLISRSYRDYVRDGETLRILNIIILSAATGMFLFAGSTGAAFTGFASVLGAGEFAFGLITAIPVLAGLLQLPVSLLVERTGKYKKIFITGGVIQRALWIAAAFIPYIFPVEQTHIWALIVIVTLAAMGGSFVSITHMSLMANVIPMDIRGRYIATRQRVCTVSSLIAGLGIAFVLDHIPGYLGYTIVFSVGGCAGLADILMYTKVSFGSIPRNLQNNTFIKGLKTCFSIPKTRNFLMFWIFWNLTVHISAPFFGKYAIDRLFLSYTTIILFGQIAANIISLLVISRWGVFLDRYGCAPLMMISAVMSTVNIAVWLPAVPGNMLPLLLFNVFGGVFWCANDTCMVNMQFSHTPDIGRPVALAVFAVVTSISAAAANILGGTLLEFFDPVMKRLNLTVMGAPFDNYKLVFCGTAVLRLVAVFIFLPRVWNEKGMTMRESLSKAYHDARGRIIYEKARLRFFRRR